MDLCRECERLRAELEATERDAEEEFGRLHDELDRLRAALAAAADKLDFAAQLLEDDNDDAGAARSVRKWSRAARAALGGPP